MPAPPPHDAATVLLGEPGREGDAPTTRVILRIVLIVLAVVFTLLVLRLLWQPIAWMLIAMFLAIALSGPVNLLARRMRRGLAITIVYLAVLLVPVAIAAVIVPPLVRQGVNLVQDLPTYAQDVQRYVEDNPQLRRLNADLGVTERLNEIAADLPAKIPEAAGVLRDLGSGLISSVFAGFTIFILSIFMVARGRVWIDAAIDLRGARHASALRGGLDRIANAVGNYVGGAIVQATIAATATFILLSVLDVPFAGALAVLVGLFDLLPLVGATLAAVIVGLVTLFNDFPTDTIVWAAFAVAYQQFENYVVQPQIQKRAVELEPFIVLVSVLFGATLFGVVGALLAIPVAATIQIALQEWWRFRLEGRLEVVRDELHPERGRERGRGEGGGEPPEPQTG